MLELSDVHTYYDEHHVLQGVSLQVAAGKVTALLGRNGVGKTTCLHSIIGFTPARSGSILFQGRELRGLPPHVIARAGLALVPQGKRLFPSLTVRETLTMAARAGEWTLRRVFDLFPVLGLRADVRSPLLSGGEQQMLIIGRALMTNPTLLLMDEPSEGLSPVLVRELGDALTQLKASGFSILLVEQNLGLALRVADDVSVLDMGRIAYSSAAAEFSRNQDAQRKHLSVDG